jgi:hypothetical protein
LVAAPQIFVRLFLAAVLGKLPSAARSPAESKNPTMWQTVRIQLALYPFLPNPQAALDVSFECESGETKNNVLRYTFDEICAAK